MSTSPDDRALVEEVQRRQAESMPKEDLRPYAGRWVALRKGHVIASDIDPVALRNQPDVKDSDIQLRVPDPRIGVLML